MMTAKKITVYLPDDMHGKLEKVRGQIKPSEICQIALMDAVEAVNADRTPEIETYLVQGGCGSYLRNFDDAERALVAVLQRLPFNIFRQLTERHLDIDIFGGTTNCVSCTMMLHNPSVLLSPDVLGDEKVIAGAMIYGIAFWWLRTIHPYSLPNEWQYHNLPMDDYSARGRKAKEEFKLNKNKLHDVLEEQIKLWGFADEYQAYRAWQHKTLNSL